MTPYLHWQRISTVTNNKRKFTAIHSICVDSVCFNNPSSMKGVIVNCYEKLYRDDHRGKVKEAWKATDNLGKQKAPGPDAFNIAFFRHC